MFPATQPELLLLVRVHSVPGATLHSPRPMLHRLEESRVLTELSFSCSIAMVSNPLAIAMDVSYGFPVSFILCTHANRPRARRRVILQAEGQTFILEPIRCMTSFLSLSEACCSSILAAVCFGPRRSTRGLVIMAQFFPFFYPFPGKVLALSRNARLKVSAEKVPSSHDLATAVAVAVAAESGSILSRSR